MNKLNEWCTKKNAQMLSMIMGVGILIFYVLTRVAVGSINSLSGAMGSLGFIAFLFLLLWLAYAVLSGVSIYFASMMYFKQQDKDIQHIVNMVCGIWMAVALLLNIQTISFFFKVSSGDIWGMSFSTLSGVQTAANFLDITFLAVLGVAIYNAVLYFKQKGKPSTIYTAAPEVKAEPTSMSSEIPAAEPVAPAPVPAPVAVEGAVAQEKQESVEEEGQPKEEAVDAPQENQSEEKSVAASTESMTQSTVAPEPAPEDKKPNETVEKAKSFLSTKKGKMIVGGISAAVVLLIVVVAVLGNKKTDLNLTDGVKVSFEGFDGEGYAYIVKDSIEYDGDSEKVRSFIDDVYFVIEGDNYELENGDTIKVVARYNETEAKRNKINPTNTTKKIKVKGLQKDYDDPDEIGKSLLKNLSAAWDSYFENILEEEIIDDLEYYFDDDFDIKVTEKTVVGKYFINDEDYKGYDSIVYLVKASVSGKEYSFGDEKKDLTKTRYFKIELDNVTNVLLEDIDEDDFYFSYSSGEFDSDEKAIKDLYDDYSGSWSSYEVIEMD